MLEENVREIEKKFDEGQQIFRRKSVEILLARIQQLEIATQQSVQLTKGSLPMNKFIQKEESNEYLLF